MNSDDSRDVTENSAPTLLGAVRRAPATPSERRAEDRVFAELFGRGDAPTRSKPAAESGWGRYTLQKKLGSGGCSVVFVGHDDTLDRDVAIKLLRAHEGQVDRGRLIREARALAKLNHPNIVEVFDVGLYDESKSEVASLAPAPHGVYVVLELVDGMALDQWLQVGRADWRARLDLMIQAGRGLSAAHAAGVVHRDFKPGNVVIGRDGRARVLDFGLAAVAGDVEAITPVDSRSELPASHGLTATGAVMGTPAYMAPEQHEGRAATEASDQYAFCITLYLALWGERPFSGKTALTLYENKVAGLQNERRFPPAGVPAAVLDLVVRGTAVKPGDRWPSMDVVLEQLVAIRRPRRWPWIAASAVVVTGSVAWASVPSAQAGVCDADRGLTSELASVWGTARQGQLDAAFSGASVPVAAATWQRITPRVEAYAAGWRDAASQWCASQLRESLAGDHTLRCLRRDLTALGGLLQQFERPDAQTVERAYDAVAALPDPARCQRGAAPQSAEASALLDRIAALLARVLVLQPEVAMTAVDALADEVDSQDDALVRDRYLRLRAEVQEHAGHNDAAATSWEQAFHLADARDDAAAAADAATNLIRIHSYLRRDAALALEWSRHAQSRLQRTSDAEREAWWRRERAVVFMRTLRFDEARADLDRVEALAVDNPKLRLLLLQDRAHLATGEGDYAGALLAHQRVVAEVAEIYGPEHRRSFGALSNLGGALQRAGKGQQAQATLADAVALGERIFPAHAVELAETRNSLASALVMDGRHAEARPLFEQALVGLGEQHVVERVRILNGLGVVARAAGDLDDAAAYLRRVIDAANTDEALIDRANAYANLAAVQAQQGDLDRGRTSFEAGISAVVEHLGPQHRRVGPFYSSLAHLETLAERWDAAAAALDSAEHIARLASDTTALYSYRFQRAELYQRQGRYAEAQTALTSAEVLLGDDPDAAGREEIAAARKKFAEQAATGTRHGSANVTAGSEPSGG